MRLVNLRCRRALFYAMLRAMSDLLRGRCFRQLRNIVLSLCKPLLASSLLSFAESPRTFWLGWRSKYVMLDRPLSSRIATASCLLCFRLPSARNPTSGFALWKPTVRNRSKHGNHNTNKL